MFWRVDLAMQSLMLVVQPSVALIKDSIWWTRSIISSNPCTNTCPYIKKLISPKLDKINIFFWFKIHGILRELNISNCS